ncbi:MAG TPA: CoA pyrophosphatase [Candidatus Angelobacter sp.]|jgi:8-oxo-dGTP pyrophosphatase MutT (NUDIX family)|nr:CoA pyrophosphatase [Candidatus Angelobacter sp.]
MATLVERLRDAVSPTASPDEPEPSDAAAVVLLFDPADAGLPLLFMRRSRLVRTHRGQIAFPGGGIEDHDESIVHAGLRELQEEMGVAPEQVDVLGQLRPVLTATSYRKVTPVVALQRGSVAPVPEPYEVAEWFRIPLAELIDAPFTARSIPGDPMARQVYFYEAGGRVIWGASAAILHDLLGRLKAA